jgi:P-type Ca2+ transporter type 2C
MWINIITQSVYQLFVTLFIYYFGLMFYFTDSPAELTAKEIFYNNNSLVFNAFVFCQIFNEVNARKINMELNIFKNIHKSTMFISVLVFTIVIQIFIVHISVVPFVPKLTQTQFQSWKQW